MSEYPGSVAVVRLRLVAVYSWNSHDSTTFWSHHNTYHDTRGPHPNCRPRCKTLPCRRLYDCSRSRSYSYVWLCTHLTVRYGHGLCWLGNANRKVFKHPSHQQCNPREILEKLHRSGLLCVFPSHLRFFPLICPSLRNVQQRQGERPCHNRVWPQRSEHGFAIDFVDTNEVYRVAAPLVIHNKAFAPGRASRRLAMSAIFLRSQKAMIDYAHSVTAKLSTPTSSTHFPCSGLHELPSPNRYMTDAINSFKAKGAIVIVASQTTRNPFNNPGATPIFVDYARQVASQTGVPFVDHYSILLRQFNAMGAGAVNALYPVDNIHTNSQGG